MTACSLSLQLLGYSTSNTGNAMLSNTAPYSSVEWAGITSRYLPGAAQSLRVTSICVGDVDNSGRESMYVHCDVGGVSRCNASCDLLRPGRYLAGITDGSDILLTYSATSTPYYVDSTVDYLGSTAGTGVTLSCAFADINSDGRLELILAKSGSIIVFSDVSISTAYAIAVAPVVTARLNDLTPYLGSTVTVKDTTTRWVLGSLMSKLVQR